jgi:hypothetical protein
MNAVYLPLPSGCLTLSRMVDPRTSEQTGACAASITAPTKSHGSSDWTEPSAKETVRKPIVVADQTLRGYNTDALAVLHPVIDRLG